MNMNWIHTKKAHKNKFYASFIQPAALLCGCTQKQIIFTFHLECAFSVSFNSLPDEKQIFDAFNSMDCYT